MAIPFFKAKFTEHWMRQMYFEIRSSWKPSRQEITDAQRSLGYHPLGYGDPVVVECEKQADGSWFTTWYCADSCD
jgi:hypothetical protein